MSKFTFILNPMAGRGSGSKHKKRILEAIRSSVSDFEFVESRSPLDATDVARRTSSPIVVAVGGDGTIHEVLNGIMGTEKILGIVPIGSGNDFVKSIGVPTRIEDAITLISTLLVNKIDVGRTQVWEDGRNGPTNSYFINGVGVGFDAAVAERTKHISYLTGRMVYVVAVLQTLHRYKSPVYSVEIDGSKSTSMNLLIAIGNGTCAGGGFYLTPNAKVDDGMLDICLITNVSTASILKLMPFVMKGMHEVLEEVQFKKGSSITIESNPPTCVHADGELLGNKVTRVKIDVIPGKLNIVAGRA